MKKILYAAVLAASAEARDFTRADIVALYTRGKGERVYLELTSNRKLKK